MDCVDGGERRRYLYSPTGSSVPAPSGAGRSLSDNQENPDNADLIFSKKAVGLIGMQKQQVNTRI